MSNTKSVTIITHDTRFFAAGFLGASALIEAWIGISFLKYINNDNYYRYYWLWLVVYHIIKSAFSSLKWSHLCVFDVVRLMEELPVDFFFLTKALPIDLVRLAEALPMHTSRFTEVTSINLNPFAGASFAVQKFHLTETLQALQVHVSNSIETLPIVQADFGEKLQKLSYLWIRIIITILINPVTVFLILCWHAENLRQPDLYIIVDF